MRALVIGADGFVGRWLVRHLAESGDDVAGVVGPNFRPPLDHAAEIRAVDVRDYAPVRQTVVSSRPDVIYFLAAVSQAGGRERIEDAARIGLIGAIHAITASAALDRPARVVHVSSSHVYGDGDTPVTEDSATAPNSVYGAAKLASERALLALGPATEVKVVVARPFNHIGPGQGPGFVVPSLVARVRAIPPGTRGSIRIGALDTVRDFTDVRDVVSAYRILATNGTPGEVYNVASGVGVSVNELVATLLELAGVEADLDPDPGLERERERRVMIGDASRLEALGWQRSHALRDTLAEVLRHPGEPGTS